LSAVRSLLARRFFFADKCSPKINWCRETPTLRLENPIDQGRVPGLRMDMRMDKGKWLVTCQLMQLSPDPKELKI
jgi:hypothetical protein